MIIQVKIMVTVYSSKNQAIRKISFLISRNIICKKSKFPLKDLTHHNSFLQSFRIFKIIQV